MTIFLETHQVTYSSRMLKIRDCTLVLLRTLSLRDSMLAHFSLFRMGVGDFYICGFEFDVYLACVLSPATDLGKEVGYVPRTAWWYSEEPPKKCPRSDNLKSLFSPIDY